MSICVNCDKYKNNEYCVDDIGFCEYQLAEHDKQIRARVIDEYKNALHIKYEENKEFACIVSEGNIYKFEAMANLDLEEIDAIADLLKDQN